MLRKTALALAISCSLAVVAQAQAPTQMPLQGVLHNIDGEPITGSVRVQFALYDLEFDGIPLWSEIQRIDVDQGLFTALLGQEEALDLSLFAHTPAVWVGVTVEDDSEMPRVPLATVPWAAWANAAGDAATVNGFDAEALHDRARASAADDAATRYAPLAHTQPWSTITGVPDDLADGDNDLLAGISCSIGEILRHGPLGWACDTEMVDVLAMIDCSAGQILRYGIDGWFCGADIDTDTDTDTLTDLGCAAGQILVRSAGGWVCGADANSGGDITAVGAGVGLSGGGDTGAVSVAVDFATTQRRVTGTCDAHQVITSVAQDGSVSCGDRFVTRYQRNEAAETRSSYNPVRYHLSVTAAAAGGDTTPIPQAVIEDLCADFDGCRVRLGLTRFAGDQFGAAASREFLFYYDTATRAHRASVADGNGVDGDGVVNHAYSIYNTCYLTDSRYTDYTQQGDPGVGMALLVWNGENFAGRTCELTIED